MLLNLCQALWASWTLCYTCWVRHVLMLVYFHYLDKNPGWITNCYSNDDFSWGLIVLWSTSWHPCAMELLWESYLYTSAIFMWRLCDNIRDVINTCDDTFHNLSAYVCDWSLGAHKIMHPILFLKLGVTQMAYLFYSIRNFRIWLRGI